VGNAHLTYDASSLVGVFGQALKKQDLKRGLKKQDLKQSKLDRETHIKTLYPSSF
jgi:hypothetical protein